MKDTKADILKFWFSETKPAQWFTKNEAFDDLIITRFSTDYTLAARGIYDAWMDDGDGCLALVILLDQFPRNMFRGSAMAFATDEKARQVTRHALLKRYDQVMKVDQKAFLYLPLEHSEEMADQDKSVTLFETLRAQNPVYADYAVRHRDVIARFGRFPHRNVVLGRDNTAEEIVYLAEPNAGF